MNDYGFTETIDIKITTTTNKMKDIEDLVLPLIDNLISSSDKDTIKWPNRKEPLEELRSKLLAITRAK